MWSLENPPKVGEKVIISKNSPYAKNLEKAKYGVICEDYKPYLTTEGWTPVLWFDKDDKPVIDSENFYRFVKIPYRQYKVEADIEPYQQQLEFEF